MKDDEVLGLDQDIQSATFESLKKAPNLLRQTIIKRITTQSNEMLLPLDSQIFTINKRKKVSQIVSEDSIDIFWNSRLFCELRDQYKANKSQIIKLKNNSQIEINEDMSYLLGTQALIPKDKRKSYRISLDIENPDNCFKICKILKRGIDGADLECNVLYNPSKTRIIVIDNTDELCLVDMISKIFDTDGPQVQIPLNVRYSSTKNLQRFLEGLLDSRAAINKEGKIRFYTFAYNNEIRRFVYCCLALFGIQPIETYIRKPTGGLKTVITYLALREGFPLSLRSLRTSSETISNTRNQNKVRVFSKVKNVSGLKADEFLVTLPKRHWNMIVDLSPIHHQITR